MDTVEATRKRRSPGQGRPTSGHVSRNPVCLRAYLAAGSRRFGALYRWSVGTLNMEQEQFGEERLRDVIRSSQFLTATEICQSVVSRLDTFTAGSPQWDDITLVVVKVKADSTD